MASDLFDDEELREVEIFFGGEAGEDPRASLDQIDFRLPRHKPDGRKGPTVARGGYRHSKRQPKDTS